MLPDCTGFCQDHARVPHRGPSPTQLGSCVKSDPSIRVSWNVSKCPLWSIALGKLCTDVVALFRRRKRLSSRLSFEFTRRLIMGRKSSNSLATRDCVAFPFPWIISFHPHDKPGGEGLSTHPLQRGNSLQEIKYLIQIAPKSKGPNREFNPSQSEGHVLNCSPSLPG